MLLTITALTLNIFDGTISPSYRWAVAHAEVKGKDVNYLITVPEQRVVATLKGFSAFESENFGDVFAAYSKDEQLVAIMHANKWQPRSLSLVATSNGAQVDMNARVQADAARWMKAPAGRPAYIYDVVGAKVDANKVSFSILGQAPSDPDGPIGYGNLTYKFTLSKTKFTLSKAEYRKMTENTVSRWPGIENW